MVMQIRRIDERVHNIPVLGTVPCGKPEIPSDGVFTADATRLIDLFCRDPRSSYAVQAYGQSMIDRNIEHGDWLIIDCSIEPIHNKIVLVAINGDMTLKVYHCPNNQRPVFLPANSRYSAIIPTEYDSVQILGVSTGKWIPFD